MRWIIIRPILDSIYLQQLILGPVDYFTGPKGLRKDNQRPQWDLKLNAGAYFQLLALNWYAFYSYSRGEKGEGVQPKARMGVNPHHFKMCSCKEKTL
jgi:hypothetical protein